MLSEKDEMFLKKNKNIKLTFNDRITLPVNKQLFLLFKSAVIENDGYEEIEFRDFLISYIRKTNKKKDNTSLYS